MAIPHLLPRPAEFQRHAVFYREEASRLRQVAAESLFGDLRQDFLTMAEQYELLARQAEANASWPHLDWTPGNSQNDGAATPLSRRR